jgi:hypothetical protein
VQEKQEVDSLAVARQAGIDLHLLDTILAQSIEERWRQHGAALTLALRLEQAGRTSDARLHDTAETPH